MALLTNYCYVIFKQQQPRIIPVELLQEALRTKRIEYRLKVWQEEQNNSDKTNSGRLLVERR